MISVVMSAWEPWNLTEHALMCVWLQSHKNWELILVCDGEPDENVRLVHRRFQKRCPGRSKLIVADRRPGCWGNIARNIGLKQAKGDHVVWVNHDNLIFPGYLEAHANNFTKEKNCISVVNIELTTKNYWLGVYPKDPIKRSHIDLLNFAMPTSVAIEIDAFGEQHATLYAADWEVFDQARKRIPVVRSECLDVLGVHF